MELLQVVQERVQNAVALLQKELSTSHDIELDVEIVMTKDGVQVVIPSKTKKQRKKKTDADVTT